MSIGKRNISIYSNLPSGGASMIADLNYKFLKQRANITLLSDSLIKPTGFFNYLYTCVYKLPAIHRVMAEKSNTNSRVLVAHHSWLTKSPHILRYVSQPKIYICQESMREYYDNKHRGLQSIKEKIINFLRLPIRYIDKQNLKSSNLTVIVNSKFSKSLIDKYYGISSKLIYPGIDTFQFKNQSKVAKKNNQIISVGAINKLKGYEFLLQVISKINMKNRPKLVIVGNGGNKIYIKKLKKLATRLNVILELKINLSKSMLIKEYLKSKLFLYAPVNEPFGIVVEEAMAAKLPLVVYKHGGGYAEILSRNNGLILNNLDSKQWAKQIATLLQNKNMLNKYGKYNSKYVNDKYSANIMNKNIWKLINSL